MRTAKSVIKIRTVEDLKQLESQPYDTLVPWRSLYDVFTATAALCGDRLALTFLDDQPLRPPVATFTHRQLLTAITRIANLFASLGANHGTSVGILARTYPQIPLSIFAASTVSAASCLNYLLAADVLSELLSAAKSTILVCPGPDLDEQLWKKVCQVAALTPSLTHILVLGEAVSLPSDSRFQSFNTALSSINADTLSVAPPARSDVAAIFHTGGTTGRPKLVPQTHGNWIHAAWSLAQELDLSESDIAVNGFPWFHVGGTTTVGMSVLAAGGHDIILSPSGFRNPSIIEQFWTIIDNFKVTYIAAVPTVISTLANTPIRHHDISKVRFALTGGSPIPEANAISFERSTGIKLIEQYGMTESVAAISCTPTNGAVVRGSVGIRSPFSDILIATSGSNDVRKACAVNEVGEVLVRGPQIVSGYTDPIVTRTTFTDDGYVISGDLGSIDAHGYLYIRGRSKDLIIRSGHNIDPLAIEEISNKYNGVKYSAAIGMPDEYAGELPVVFLELIPGFTINPEIFLKYMTDSIFEPPARPKQVFVLDQLPVTGVGKIFKPALRNMALEHKLRQILDNIQSNESKIFDIVNISCEDNGSVAHIVLRAINLNMKATTKSQLAKQFSRLNIQTAITWQ